MHDTNYVYYMVKFTDQYIPHVLMSVLLILMSVHIYIYIFEACMV